MKNPENSDFLVLNRMIYRIYTTEDEKTMRIDLLEQMKMLVDFDAADFYLAGEGKEVLGDPALYNCEGTEAYGRGKEPCDPGNRSGRGGEKAGKPVLQKGIPAGKLELFPADGACQRKTVSWYHDTIPFHREGQF